MTDGFHLMPYEIQFMTETTDCVRSACCRVRLVAVLLNEGSFSIISDNLGILG